MFSKAKFTLTSFVLLIVGLMAVTASAGAAKAPDPVNHDYILYISTPSNGTVDGIAYADEDVLKYDSAADSWSLFFDGTANGIPATADIDAFAYRFTPQLFMSHFFFSFDKPTQIPGLGKVDDSDVVHLTKQFGISTWSMFFDGSKYGLTTNAEDIDAIDLFNINANEQIMVFSTSGNFTIPPKVSGREGDQILWLVGTNTFDSISSGAVDIEGGDLWGLASDEEAGTLYLTMQKGYQMNGYTLNSGDVVEVLSAKNPGLYVGLLWDASAHGFSQIDALEVELP